MKPLIQKAIKNGAVILDVRSPGEFAEGHYKGSINIPVQVLDQNLNQLDTNKEIIVCCAAGGRSAVAAAILKARGFSFILDAGSWTNLSG